MDRVILLVTRNKRKINPIRGILMDTANFEHVPDENYWKINSTSSDRVYKVFKNNTGYYCDCVFNTKYIPYRPGEKKHKSKIECLHILALRVYLAITKG